MPFLFRGHGAGAGPSGVEMSAAPAGAGSPESRPVGTGRPGAARRFVTPDRRPGCRPNLTRVAPFEFAPAALPDDVRRSYTRYGCQSDLIFATLMVRNGREFAGLPAVVDGDVELSWRELMDAAARFGGFLVGHGIGPGDVVTWQLPNWWEAVVVAYGIWAAGAVSNPVVPIYRGLELRQIVEAVRPRCVVWCR